MIGNQAIINQQIFEHPKNPIKETIGDKEAMDVIYMITEEYWKEWRRVLTHSENPHIKQDGLGVYSLMYGKSKSHLRNLLKKIRHVRWKYADTYLVEDTRAWGMHNSYMKNFRETWKQVDQIKREVVHNLELWKQKKIAKYGDKAIL